MTAAISVKGLRKSIGPSTGSSPTHIVSLLRGSWFGEPRGRHVTATLVPGGLLAVGAAVSAPTFRWE
jgi:hypothetical protein